MNELNLKGVYKIIVEDISFIGGADISSRKIIIATETGFIFINLSSANKSALKIYRQKNKNLNMFNNILNIN